VRGQLPYWGGSGRRTIAIIISTNMRGHNEIKAIIFDWGWTLYDHDNNTEAPDADEVLRFIQKKDIRLVVASLAQRAAERQNEIENSPLAKYFEFIITTDFDLSPDKDKILETAVLRLGLPRSKILIVDDRTVRGIRYGNSNGHPTVWLKKGKFESELPDDSTGAPTYTIHELSELKIIV